MFVMFASKFPPKTIYVCAAEAVPKYVENGFTKLVDPVRFGYPNPGAAPFRA